MSSLFVLISIIIICPGEKTKKQQHKKNINKQNQNKKTKKQQQKTCYWKWVTDK